MKKLLALVFSLLALTAQAQGIKISDLPGVSPALAGDVVPMSNLSRSTSSSYTLSVATISAYVHSNLGTVQVASGGTGVTAAGSSGNVLTSNGTSWVSSAPAGGMASGGAITNAMPYSVMRANAAGNLDVTTNLSYGGVAANTLAVGTSAASSGGSVRALTSIFGTSGSSSAAAVAVGVGAVSTGIYDDSGANQMKFATGGTQRGTIYSSAWINHTGNYVLDASSTTNISSNVAGIVNVGTGALASTAGTLVTANLQTNGVITVGKTITAPGTTGAQTINTISGAVNFAATDTTLVVTNNKVTTASLLFCTVATNDGTATLKNCVAGAGSFTITLTAAATAETRVNFLVTN